MNNMRPLNFSAVLLAGLLSIVTTTASALGPVDGEIGIATWENNFQADLSEFEIDAGTTFVYGEGWIGDRWGLRGAWYDSDLEGEAFSNQNRFNVELRRRLLSASDNNFLALGGGLEQIDLLGGSDTQGLRLSIEGRFGIPGPLFFYGRLGWVPYFEDAGIFEDISATELDAGIHITPFPFLSVRLGYLEYEIDYDSAGASGSTDTDGFYLGLGFHW